MSKERRRIDGILELLKKFPSAPKAGLPASVGVEELDDCAVVPLGNGADLIIGSDFIRGEEFHLYRAGMLTRQDIGYFLIGANASDLAAMGAAPLGVVVAFRYTPEMSDNDFQEIMEGICGACSDFGMPLLGGDTGGYSFSVLSAAALGTCPSGRALLRSGGKEGDKLFLTGDVGTAGAAIRYFINTPKENRTLTRQHEEHLLSAWRKVRPAIEQGRLLVESGLSRCAIDTSDGLKVSCEQLAAASHLDVVVQPSRVPLSDVAKRVADLCGLDRLEVAFGDSVDFRLLFSVGKKEVEKLNDLFASRNFPLFEIGEFRRTESKPAAYLDSPDGLGFIPGVGWLQ